MATEMLEDTCTVALSTGVLTLEVQDGPRIEDFCDFAARANPKRGFLIVSKVLGRHLPARPARMRETMRYLAESLSADLPGPVVILGMAETATALGQGVFKVYRQTNPRTAAVYLQTSRQRVKGAKIIASFEEGHSHATSHIVQTDNNAVDHMLRAARTLVIVDDESSTGNTFVAAGNAMREAMPMLERIETVCITDWSDLSYLPKMPVAAQANSILSGRMQWTKGETPETVTLAAASNNGGVAPPDGMTSRAGILSEERARRDYVAISKKERVLVLGDGEHSYEALLIAEEIERQGGIAAVQCITRSPALLGHAIESVSYFNDAYGSGAPCFLYNILAHKPDRIVIAAEIVADQVEMTQQALDALGSDAPVEIYECRYGDVA